MKYFRNFPLLNLAHSLARQKHKQVKRSSIPESRGYQSSSVRPALLIQVIMFLRDTPGRLGSEAGEGGWRGRLGMESGEGSWRERLGKEANLRLSLERHLQVPATSSELTLSTWFFLGHCVSQIISQYQVPLQ